MNHLARCPMLMMIYFMELRSALYIYWHSYKLLVPGRRGSARSHRWRCQATLLLPGYEVGGLSGAEVVKDVAGCQHPC